MAQENGQNYKGQSLAIQRKGSHPAVLFARKRGERLASAVYMVTDLFDTTEPLRWELRKQSVALVSFINELESEQEKDLSRTKKCDSVFCSLVSLIDLALQARLVSPMNASLLKEEFTALEKFLKEQHSLFTETDGVIFPENYFSYGDENIFKGQKGQNKNVSGISLQQREVSFKKEIPKRSSVKDISNESRETGVPLRISTGAKGSRRNAIVELLRTKGEMSIKDISAIISGCSDKTIQRELTSLVQNGAVLKRGERRWSTYVLKD